MKYAVPQEIEAAEADVRIVPTLGAITQPTPVGTPGD